MLIINQKVNRTLYIICIATAVFCRTPPSESTEKLTENLDKKGSGIRMMLLIVFIILCALVFICKKFAKSSQQQEIEVVRSFSSESSPEPAIISLNIPYDDEDYKSRPLQCNVKFYDHQTNVDLSSAREEKSDMNTEPLTPTMLELDTKSLQPHQSEQPTNRVTKPSDEVLNTRMTNSKALTTLELDARSLHTQEEEPPPNRVIEPIGSLTRSVEVLNSRITRKLLFGKFMDVMKIGWTSKETSKIAAQVV